MTIPEPRNLTGIFENTTGIVGMMKGVNDTLMNGYFGILLLVSIWIMLFMGFMKTTAHAGKSALSSSFIIFILSVLLRALNIVNDLTMYGALALFALTLAFLFPRD